MTGQERNFTVLVVDDDAEFVWTLHNYFLICEFNVLTASNGEEALSILLDKEVHVVLTDLRMPGMDGLELLRRIQAHDFTIQVVMMTAFSTMDLARRALCAGASDFIVKPFGDMDAIVEVIRAAAERVFRWRAVLGEGGAPGRAEG